MKRSTQLLAIVSFSLFLSASLFAQDNAKNDAIILFKSEIIEGIKELPVDGAYLTNKSYDWLEKWMPTFNQARFDCEYWVEIKNEFKVGFELLETSHADFRIFNTDGKLVAEEQHQLAKGIHRFPINAKDWQKGGYIIQIQTNEGGILKKVVKI